MSTDLVDLLAAMSDYFHERERYNKAVEGVTMHDSFDWYGRDYIEALDKAYQRVVTEWDKVAAQTREAVQATSERTA